MPHGVTEEGDVPEGAPPFSLQAAWMAKRRQSGPCRGIAMRAGGRYLQPPGTRAPCGGARGASGTFHAWPGVLSMKH